MSGCHESGSPCGDYGFGYGRGRNNVDHCDARRPNDPGKSATVEHKHYPPVVDASSDSFTPPRPAVMYDSTLITPFPPTSRGGFTYTSPQAGFGQDAAASCGKLINDLDCGRVIYQNQPGDLSFRDMDSDTWFYYLYDMGTWGGTVGLPCYRIITENRAGSTTTSQSGTDPVTGDPTSTVTGTSTDEDGSSQRCVPCQNFYCTPVDSYCSYTYSGPDETGDPDCPYPLLFGIGTNSRKIVIEYNDLASSDPDGVTDVNFVYSPDSIDEDVWNQNSFSPGDPVITSQTGWEQEEAFFEDFFISTLETGNATDGVGFQVKVKIKPALQDNAVDPEGPPDIIGTSWELMEIMSQGQNYTVNDTFTLTYERLHPSGGTTNFTIGAKVTATGAVTTILGAQNFDLLIVGDKLNGHVVTNTAHMDLDNMPYHVIYLDGSGNDFAKDTQYTSSRNHNVTVVAGYGIVDRAFFGGLYEFFDKSVQYTVHDIDPESPYTYSGASDSVIQPEVKTGVVNGRLTSVSIEDGGSNWDTLKEEPLLSVTAPPATTGEIATVDGEFTNGVLTGIKITNPGSGYNDLDPPSVYVVNYYTRKEEPAGPGTPVEDMGTANVTKVQEGDDFTVKGPDGEDLNLNNSELIKGMGMQDEYEGSVTLSQEMTDKIKRETGVDLSPNVQYENVKIKNKEGKLVENTDAFGLTQQQYFNQKTVIAAKGAMTPVNQPMKGTTSMENVNQVAGPTTYETQSPGNTPKYDQKRTRKEALPRVGYNPEALDELRGIQQVPDLTLPPENRDILPPEWHDDREREKKTQEDAINGMFDGLTQKDADLIYTNPEPYVETAQRRFVNLPYASRFTKYYIKQYRPDGNIDTKINITVGCNVAEDGCGHIEPGCPPPGMPADSSTTTSSTDDQGETTDYTVSYTYTTSPMLGDGCKSWTASGSMLVRHNLTKATQTYANAVEAYGNPFF
ncbi:structural protein [Synechococcus phage S-MS29]|nr:structural protein [Synechococcus phage S-MS29]